MAKNKNSEPHEIAIAGEMKSDLLEQFLDVPPGGTCTIYFDCEGGSSYAALAITTLIRYRKLNATAVVLGQCASAALWPFAACRKRLVTPTSVFLFHSLRWESEENVLVAEANEWARHFGQLQHEMDALLARLLPVDPKVLAEWNSPGRYLSGRDLAEAKLAEMIDVFA